MTGARGKATARGSRDALKAVDDGKVGKRKATTKANKQKIKKDPNKPKRPPSAFFSFLEEFRVTFKRENPNVKAVSAVGKAGGEKWKAMSAAEKKPYEQRAARRKQEYNLLLDAYNRKQAGEDDDDDDDKSDRSKSEVDEEEEDEEED